MRAEKSIYDAVSPRHQHYQQRHKASPAQPLTKWMAKQVDADLLIGVTALELGYSVATGNLRHFELVPGLSVTQL